MKKKAKSLRQELPPCTLFLDDIEEIMKQMKSVDSDIEVANKDYEFDSIKELTKNSGNKIRELSLRGYGISVDIEKHRISIDVAGYQDKDIGVFYSLREFLRTKAGWPRRFLRPMRWWFVVSLSLIGVFVLLMIIEHNPELKVIYPIYTTIFDLFFFFFLISLLLTWRGTTIYLKKRHNVSNFWERNRDSIIVGIITAVIGGIAGAIIMYFLVG